MNDYANITQITLLVRRLDIGTKVIRVRQHSQENQLFKYTKTRSHTDNFGENNVKCLIAKGICRFVPHSSAGGF